MKIESKDFKIRNLFSRKKYTIPDYQRNYSWTIDEEIATFWDDFNYYASKIPKTNFFIGPMVFKGQNINSSEFEVVDGQQRLITFSILLSVLVSLFKKYQRGDLSDGLKQFLVYRDEKNNDQLVINTVEPHPFFQARIFHAQDTLKPQKTSEKLIESARDFFEKEIEKNLSQKDENSKKIDFLEKMRDDIFDIDTVIIVSDDETDAFTIFETINTRGKDLSSLDLLKNYIFKNYPPLAGIEEPKGIWKKIVDNTEVNRDMFFNRFWASWVVKVTENKLYRRFSDHVRDSKNTEFTNTEALLESLLAASFAYKKITKPLLDDWKVNKNFHIYYHIKNINSLFNLKVHFPFFLALFEEFESGGINTSQMDKALMLMENFHFIFTHMVSPRASGLDNKYSKFAIRLRKEIDKKKVVDDLRVELLEKMPIESEYIEKFKKLDYLKDKDTIKFILLRLEKEKDPSLVLDLELNSIEHLDPKSGKFQNKNSIGNLFLLEDKFNEKKEDLKPFENQKGEKETILYFLAKETKYKMSRDEFTKILETGSWSEADIDKRTLYLATITYKLFSKL